jgi:hypothetical protein
VIFHTVIFICRERAGIISTPRSDTLLKMHELCQSPTQTYDNHLTPTLSPPPPPLAAAYETMLVVHDDNSPILLPLIPRRFAISTDDEPSFVFGKQVFRPIPIRISPIQRSKMNNNPCDIIFDKQVLFRPITFEPPRLRPRRKSEHQKHCVFMTKRHHSRL